MSGARRWTPEERVLRDLHGLMKDEAGLAQAADCIRRAEADVWRRAADLCEQEIGQQGCPKGADEAPTPRTSRRAFYEKHVEEAWRQAGYWMARRLREEALRHHSRPGGGAAMSLYKILDEQGRSMYGKMEWPLPRDGEEWGAWVEVEGLLVPCEHGIHVCRREQVVEWLGPRIHPVQVAGDEVDAGNKVVVRAARVGHALEGWTDTTARLFAVACAVGAMVRTGWRDKRSWRAVEVALQHARGRATGEDLAAAWSAATRDTAWTTAAAAARDAAAAARYAARGTAWSAAAAATAAAAAWRGTAWSARAEQTALLWHLIEHGELPDAETVARIKQEGEQRESSSP